MVAPEASPATLAALVASPRSSGILTDFDGTLAPIVANPAAAEPLADAVEVLHRLARRYARVAVVSGRPARFLAEHLRLADGNRASGLLATGLYGLETAVGDEVTSHPESDQWRPVVSAVADLAEEQAPPGVFVERKGLSVTLHYRNNPVAESWCRRWAVEQAEGTGLRLHPARMSEELRPPIPVDKGTVVATLASGLQAACFLGDDRGDLPAFAALKEIEAAQPGFVAVTVAVRSAEAPVELLEAADLVVDGPPGALSLLRTLL
ncbi:MAG TPA: trehalose-phosphatase [Acidimicrobiales bacterium]|nr:trehalose-phosphatase [Acidimicrobiales bacterium]